MPSRRGGRKSHHGCQNCKRRHLKCDEALPTCSRCAKRNELCVRTYSPFRNTSPKTTTSLGQQWAAVTGARQHQHSDLAISTSSRSDASGEVTPHSAERKQTPVLPGICSRLADYIPDSSVSSPSFGHDGDWLDEMLTKHYIDVVSFTLNENPKVLPLYTQYLPELAKKHAILNHGMLTISVAHCVAALSDQKGVVDRRSIRALIERCLHHNSTMLSLFAQQISIIQYDERQEISNDECAQITMASIIVMGSFVAQLHGAFHEYAHDSPRAVDKAVALLNLMGPIAKFFDLYSAQLASTELKVYDANYLPDVENGMRRVPEAATRGLDQAVLMCSQPGISHDVRIMYTAALLGLRKTYEHVALDQDTIGGRFLWAHGDVAAFMASDIYKRTPEALVLLAFWAGSLIPWPHWWGTDFAKKLILEVLATLPPAYLQYMDWPRSRLDVR